MDDDDDDEKFIESLMMKDDKTNKSGVAKNNNNNQGSCTKIQKVDKSKMMTKNEIKKYYFPQMIAIGPTHAEYHEKNNQNKNNLKKILVKKFIKDGGNLEARSLLKEIKEKFNLDEQNKLFHEKVKTKLNERQLARMLFQDGCVVLQFIHSYVNGEIIEFNEISIAEIDQICQDLLLVENQIPFEVLVILMRLSKIGSDLAKSVYHFISMNIMAPDIFYEKRLNHNLSRVPANPEELFRGNNMLRLPVHLLDLLRSELLYEEEQEQECRDPPIPDDDHKPEREKIKNKGDASAHSSSYYQRSFRNVQDLKEVDIKLKANYSKGLKSVSFSSTSLFFSPTLKLPPLIVDNSTKQKLLNLVAYEMFPDNNKRNYAIASYVRLLDSLIDCEKDVKDLRSAHILRNLLGSDKEVAELFNNISYINLGPKHDIYVDVKKQIQKHYQKKWSSWTAEFHQQHCRNPSTFFAFVVGLVILVATCIQAIYTVIQAE
ncbi:hypothetical protein CsatB_014106 [Cannabis sativa]